MHAMQAPCIVCDKETMLDELHDCLVTAKDDEDIPYFLVTGAQVAATACRRWTIGLLRQLFSKVGLPFPWLPTHPLWCGTAQNRCVRLSRPHVGAHLTNLPAARPFPPAAKGWGVCWGKGGQCQRVLRALLILRMPG